MERPEALEAGLVIMASLDEVGLLNGIEESLLPKGASSMPAEYFWQDFSDRVFRFILSTARVHHQWAGIERL